MARARHHLVVATIALLAACTSGNEAADSIPDLPVVDLENLEQTITESERPVILNVWASWCLPCRDEAPLFGQAFVEYGDRVSFIGLDYQDNQPGARDFLAEFDLPFPHYFDEEGVVPARYGGLGVPRTYFFAPGGELVKTHNGVIDAAELAHQIENLLG